MNVREKYPDAFLNVNQTRLDAAEQLLASFNKKAMTDWAREATVTQELGHQSFRMLVSQGENDSKVLFAGGELGNGLDALGALARIRVIREIVDPSATIVYQPNSTLTENNVNFSKPERNLLKHGNSSPLTDRILKTFDSIGEPAEVIAYGPSQGAMVALALAADANTPAMALAAVEVPNITNRGRIKMARDFAGAGSSLKENIGMNFDQGAQFHDDLINGLSVKPLIGYGLGLMNKDNLRLVDVMGKNTAEAQMRINLEKGGSIVHAWATGDTVSPHADNEIISSHLYGIPRYEHAIFDGDHSITNIYLLNAALVHRAAFLMNN